MRNAIALLVIVVLFVATSANAVPTIATNALHTEDDGAITTIEDPQTGPLPATITSSVAGSGFSAQASVNTLGVNAAHVDAGFADGDDHVVRAEASFSDMITNNSGNAQDFFYDFTIDAPFLEVTSSSNISFEEQRPASSYLIEIKVDGAIVFSSSAELRGSGSGIVALTENGTDLGGDTINTTGVINSNHNVQFDDFATNLFLGNFGDGETFTFETFIEARHTNVGNEVGGIAFIGDPGDINASGGISGTITSQDAGEPGNNSSVPEPITATLGLIGLGVLGMATRRRVA